MSLFSCCPKKPKKSLDYVIKWVEDADKTLKELTIWKDTIDENISELVTEAIENYDWSNLPVEALSRKADKVENAVQGDFAGFDETGNLIDSGKKPADFAEADHSHIGISSPNGGEVYTDDNKVYIGVLDAEEDDDIVEINNSNIANLRRALTTPDGTPIASSGNLVTSGGVKAALDNKTNLTQADIDSIVEVEVKHVGDDEYDQAKVIGRNRIVIGVGTDAEDGSAIIDANNITNLQRALLNPDRSPTANSTNLVTSGGVKAALEGKRDLVGQTISLVINGQEIEIESSDVPNLIRALSNPDSTTPIKDSNNLVTSGAVYAALTGKMDTKTIDSTPADNADHLVSSKAVYDALLNAGGIASVNLHATVVKDNGSYTYFGVRYGSDQSEGNWPEGDPEEMYAKLTQALGENGNTVVPFELTVKNENNVTQAIVLGLVHYTKRSETQSYMTTYYHNYRFCIGSFEYIFTIHEVQDEYEFVESAFVTSNYSSNL